MTAVSTHPPGSFPTTTRRGFMAATGALTAAALSPIGLTALTARNGPDALILLSLRGGADVLSLCIPHGDPDYFRARPSIAIPHPRSGAPDAALDLDGFFGLPPALAPLLPLFRAGHLAIVHAAGTPTRHDSHFQAQHALDSGTPDHPRTPTGWLARALDTLNPSSAHHAIALGALSPLSLVGSTRSATIPLPIAPRSTPSPLASAISEAAARIDADPTLRAVAIDSTGWDTHAHQNPRSGPFAATMADLAHALESFALCAITPAARPITLIVTTEFGRTIAENPTRGTDHGHGSVIFILGRHIAGGRVITRWPGLNARDLAATIDTRDIFAEVLTKRLAHPNLAPIFPNHSPTNHDLFNA